MADRNFQTPTLPTLSDVTGELWDVIIVGAGPAGSSAAISLATSGLKILLVDKALFPRWKVCGCCLNIAAMKLLGELGLPQSAAVFNAPRLTSIQLVSDTYTARLPLPGGIALSRTALDSELVSLAVARGVVFCPGTEAKLGRAERDSRRCLLRCGDKEIVVKGRVILAADGLAGRFLVDEPSLNAVPVRQARIGAGVVAPVAPAFYQPGTIYMNCGEGGYLGMVRLEDGRLNLAAAFDAQAVRRGDPGQAAASLLRSTGLPMVESVADFPWRGTPALTRRPTRLAAERILLIGDAAGYVEPFTGEGITWALAAGIAVAAYARSAAARWRPELADQWQRTHQRLLARRQRTCRWISLALRKPWLVRTILNILTCMPRLANPVIRHLNAVPRS